MGDEAKEVPIMAGVSLVGGRFPAGCPPMAVSKSEARACCCCVVRPRSSSLSSSSNSFVFLISSIFSSTCGLVSAASSAMEFAAMEFAAKGFAANASAGWPNG